MSSNVALPQGDEKREVVTAMFDRVAPSYERLNRLISAGQDGRWRAKTLAALDLPIGSTVLDIACGTGDLCRSLADAGRRPIGVDLSTGMLRHAHAPAPLVLGDALAIPVATGSVDGLVCGFALRNFVDLDAFFAEAARVVRTDGRIALLDAAEPTGRIAKTGHSVWFKHAVPRIAALFGGDRDAYRYLPASTAYLPDGPTLIRRLAAAGFTTVERETLMMGAVQIISGRRA
jgi:demethylmenaquinone methyltransferase/2-methoxy-6-polyprenyl-1,4-benzoquinol methylase